MIMMNFRLRLKKIGRLKNTRIKFDLEKLKDPNITEEFKAMIGGTFAPLTLAQEEVETTTNNFNTAVRSLENNARKINPGHRRLASNVR